MRIGVLGAGAMGSAAARLLGRHDDVEILVLDIDADRARTVAAEIGADHRGVDIGSGSLRDALSGVQSVAACIPYRLNLPVMEAALTAGCHYADLGGLFHTTRRQLGLNAKFREAGLSAVLGIGSAPGITNLLARAGADRLDAVTSVDMLDGAVDRSGEFGLPYSAETVLDEFTLPAMVYEDGTMREVPAASGTVRYEFPEPIGAQEAFYTLHSEPATLPATIEGVRDVRWRLALPEAIARGFRLLVSVGLAGTDPVELPGGAVAPRDLLIALLNRLPSAGDAPQDVECIDAVVRGLRDGRGTTFVGRALLRPSPEGLSAGAFGTAIPIATMARWQAAGRIQPGVHPPETSVAAEAFLDDLAAEGVEVSFPPAPPGAAALG